MNARHCLLAMLLLASLATSNAWGQSVSVQELQANRTKFLGRATTVEGRLTSFGKNLIRLRKCDIPFRTSEQIPTVPGLPKFLELTGQLTLEEGRYVFNVASYKELDSDLDIFEERRKGIREKKPSSWYQLADWAHSRGKFYNDTPLLEKAESAYLKGVEIERGETPADRGQHLLKLAAKAKGFELPESLRLSLVHEACYEYMQQAAKQTKSEELEELAGTLDRLLPDCQTPLKGDHSKLLASYRRDPVGVYDKAAEEDRLVIHRMLYADIVRRSIETKLAADGSNGFEVAELLDDRVPEFHDVAEKLRDQTLAKRATEVQQRTRSEVLKLAADYRARKQEAPARQVIESWLTLRQRKLEPDDIEATIYLAEDYRTLLQSHDAANRLLLAAAKRRPESTELQERLQRAGFRQKDGVWLSAKELTGRAEDPAERAAREGRIEPGMTGSMVRRSLGEPRSIGRAASNGQISEVWSYGQGGQMRLTIQLSKRPQQQELRVLDVNQIAAP